MRPRTWSAGSSRRATGFTLLELLAVLMLAGLVLAVTPPLISNALPGVQLKGTVRTLISALHQTRNRAIGEARPQHLVVDLQEREVTVPGRPRPIRVPSGVEMEVTVAQSQQQGPQQAAVAFFPDGSSTGGRFRLTRERQAYRVDVDWLTGKVTLVD